MRRSNYELKLAFLAIIFITFAYLFMVIVTARIPPAYEFYGHSIGILGFLLMLMTETLYTLRKRSRDARWGRMAAWLQFHIFTGLVGPYMVLLHTSWKFNGVAGVLTLLTAIIVLSGFVGRYIYTAVPRTADGVEVESGELQRQIAILENELRHWAETHPEVGRILARRLAGENALQGNALAMVWGRGVWDVRYRFEWWMEKQRMDTSLRRPVERLEEVLHRREVLRRQVASLATARRLLALWHAVHIPIGLALFTLALVHVVAAVYFASLLH